MNFEPEPTRELALDSLVRAYLDRQAEQTDPRPHLERIQRRLLGPALVAEATTRRRHRRWVGSLVAAAVLMVAVGGSLFWSNRLALASGTVLLREARQTHRAAIDRCYLVDLHRESDQVAELTPLTPLVRSTRLWTRGDRFWVESTRPEQRWSWGRDSANRFWIAFNPQTGVRLDSAEVPPWLNIYCDLHSLNVEQWLSDVLGRFEIQRESVSAASDSATVVVSAHARTTNPDYPSVEFAHFEIDAETRVVRRMVIRRVWKNRPFATVTYSLIETDTRPLTEYAIEGHVDEAAEIYTKDHEPERRQEILRRWFGSLPGRRFRASVAVPPTDQPQAKSDRGQP